MTDTTLPDYSESYDPDLDFDHWYTLATAAAVAKWLNSGERVLELGCATGLMTATLVAAGSTVVGVDRSDRYLEIARKRQLTDATFFQGDVVTFSEGSPYDHVIATNLIHELPDPVLFLRRCAERLVPGGRLHLSVQNPHSIHRLIALELGLISNVFEISARGRRYSTFQLFDADQLAGMARDAGLALVHQQGVMLKPLPNELMAHLPTQAIEGFVAVAHRFPRNCAMNYFVFTA